MALQRLFSYVRRLIIIAPTTGKDAAYAGLVCEEEPVDFYWIILAPSGLDVGNQLVDRFCRLLLPLQGLQGSEKSKVKYIAVWRIRGLILQLEV